MHALVRTSLFTCLLAGCIMLFFGCNKKKDTPLGPGASATDVVLNVPGMN